MKIWEYLAGMTAHVMTFEVGAVLEDAKWQAPVYCFKEAEEEKSLLLESVVGRGFSREGLMRGAFNH